MEDVERAEGEDGARHAAASFQVGSGRSVRSRVGENRRMATTHRSTALGPDDRRRPRGRRPTRVGAAPDAHASPSGCCSSPRVVYVATLGQDGFLGFVNAGAEASMVGAIADWFAVTALFKHPLGLPIPHTALIPKRKDELGRGLEEFVGENFLQEDIIRERLAAAAPSQRLGAWLAEPANARRVVDEVADVAAIALSKVRDEHIESLVRDALTPRFREEPISPLLGGLLAEALRDDLHHGLVDLALDELHGWLVENPETVAEVLGERAPWWAPPRLNERGHRHASTSSWSAGSSDIRDDPHHRARQALDSMLAQLAQDLLTDPDTQARAERAQGAAARPPRRSSPSASRSGTPCAGR